MAGSFRGSTPSRFSAALFHLERNVFIPRLRLVKRAPNPPILYWNVATVYPPEFFQLPDCIVNRHACPGMP